MSDIEAAKAAIQIMRAAEGLVEASAQCPHPAEALTHSAIMAAWQCSECGLGVPDENVVRWLEDKGVS